MAGRQGRHGAHGDWRCSVMTLGCSHAAGLKCKAPLRLVRLAFRISRLQSRSGWAVQLQHACELPQRRQPATPTCASSAPPVSYANTFHATASQPESSCQMPNNQVVTHVSQLGGMLLLLLLQPPLQLLHALQAHTMRTSDAAVCDCKRALHAYLKQGARRRLGAYRAQVHKLPSLHLRMPANPDPAASPPVLQAGRPPQTAPPRLWPAPCAAAVPACPARPGRPPAGAAAPTGCPGATTAAVEKGGRRSAVVRARVKAGQGATMMALWSHLST